MYNLGVLCRRGEGTARDSAAALQWYEKALRGGAGAVSRELPAACAADAAAECRRDRRCVEAAQFVQKAAQYGLPGTDPTPERCASCKHRA